MPFRLDKSIFKKANVFIDRHEIEDVEAHSHDFMEIAFIYIGSGKHIVNEKEMNYEKGDYFIINQNATHRFISNGKSVIYNCIFTLDFLDLSMLHITDLNQLAAHHLFSPLMITIEVSPYDYTYKSNKKIKELFEEMLSEYERQETGYLKILQADVLKLIVLSLRQISLLKLNLPLNDNETYDKIIRHIYEHYNSEIKRETLANMAYVSGEHFSRQFKKYMGISTTQFVKLLRVNEARKLLLTTNLPVVEIAGKVGYSDEKHFAKVFGAMAGMPPSKYRKSNSF